MVFLLDIKGFLRDPESIILDIGDAVRNMSIPCNLLRFLRRTVIFLRIYSYILNISGRILRVLNIFPAEFGDC